MLIVMSRMRIIAAFFVINCINMGICQLKKLQKGGKTFRQEMQ